MTAATASGAWRKNISYELLKVNLLAICAASGFHVDTLDLYSARQRAVFTKQAAEELGVKEDIIRRDLGRVLLKLEELQDEQIAKGAGAEAGSTVDAERGGTSRRAGAAARSAAARPHPGRLRALRRGGRRDQQAGRLPGRRLAAAGSAAGRASCNRARPPAKAR